jgi:NAD(P)-dependent dehydrogenase (short-subunit alcohol dehydrogenase family)
MHQVRAAVDQFLALDEPLHVLINNAGVVDTKRVVVEVEGTEQEQMFAVNHLGHFLLTNLLLPNLIGTAEITHRPSRIVVVSSEAHALFCRGIDFDDLSQSKRFSGYRAYGRSKLANILMVKELAKRVDGNKVLINCLHPGAVKSSFGENIEPKWYTPIVMGILHLFFITSEQGADTSLFLATGDGVTHGDYYYRRKVHRLKPWALDEAAAAQLWDVSKTILNLT